MFNIKITVNGKETAEVKTDDRQAARGIYLLAEENASKLKVVVTQTVEAQPVKFPKRTAKS